MMTNDLTEKYRPQFFRDFWNSGGPVDFVQEAYRKGRLPKRLLLQGRRGVGKTSLARVMGYLLSCKGVIDAEPCRSCEGCRNATRPFMGLYGNVARFRGNDFSVEILRKFVEDATWYDAPSPSEVYLAIVDEAHLMHPSVQVKFLDHVEDIKRAHFVFCTTNDKGLLDDLTGRFCIKEMRSPSEEDNLRSLRTIADKEGIQASTDTLMRIIKSQDRLPRNCLIALQSYAVDGKIPDDNTADSEPIIF